MSYILIESNDDLTSQERAELITRELYNIIKAAEADLPGDDPSRYRDLGLVRGARNGGER